MDEFKSVQDVVEDEFDMVLVYASKKAWSDYLSQILFLELHYDEYIFQLLLRFLILGNDDINKLGNIVAAIKSGYLVNLSHNLKLS